MGTYNSGATYNSGTRYNEAPVSQPKKRMAQAKLDLKSRSDAELGTFADAHIAAMTGNANFTTPEPSAADFAGGLAAFKAALTASDAAQQAATEKVAAKDAARTAFETLFTTRRNYIDNKSGGVDAKILSAGVGVRAPGAPVGDLPAPLDFLATAGDNAGEIDLTWSAVKGARSYVSQYREDVVGTAWITGPIGTRSRATVPGLQTAKTYVFRVAAVGTAGQSPWSDESTKLAP